MNKLCMLLLLGVIGCSDSTGKERPYAGLDYNIQTHTVDVPNGKPIVCIVVSSGHGVAVSCKEQSIY